MGLGGGSGGGSHRDVGAGRRGGEGAGRLQGLHPGPALAAPCPAHGAPPSARPSPQGQTPLPGGPRFCPGPRPAQPNLPAACALTARSGRTGAVLPAGAPDNRPHCDSTPVLSQVPERITGTPLPGLASPGLSPSFLLHLLVFSLFCFLFNSPLLLPFLFFLLPLRSPVPVHLPFPFLFFPFSSLLCPAPAFSSFSPYLLLWRAHTGPGS